MSENGSGDRRERNRTGLAEWDPIYFAFVMATGIVSIAAWLLDYRLLGRALFAGNVAAYVVVSALTLVRIARDPRETVRDLADYDRAVGSFTAVAGTCVLGSQFAVLGVSTTIAAALLVVGAALWFVLVYAVFGGLTCRHVDEPIEASLDGSWFLIVVGAQSVAVLGALLAPEYPGAAVEALLGALTLYAIGGMLYLVLITLIVYRLIFFPFDPEDAAPPYWINMGAVAITTLAGAAILAAADQWAFVGEIRPFLVGFTFFYWAVGTWWIPLLFALGVWRHVIGDVDYPFTASGYDPRYWGLVFPLGMYVASTYRFAEVTALDVIAGVPRYFLPVAVLAWVAVAIGLCRHAVASVR